MGLQLHDVSTTYSRLNESNAVEGIDDGGSTSESGPESHLAAVEEQIRKIDGYISDVYQSLAANSVLVVCTGQAISGEVKRMWCDKKASATWSDQEEARLQQAVEASRRGFVAVLVKR